MNEKIAAALRKITEDEALLAKLQACADPDEAYAIVSSVENGFTKEEFIAAMEQVKAAIDASTTLSEDDISKMAGGVDGADVTVAVSVSASAVSATASIAAAATAAI